VERWRQGLMRLRAGKAEVIFNKGGKTAKPAIPPLSNYSIVLDYLMEGCQLIGFDLRYLYVNDAAARYNRRPKEELIGKKYSDIWPGAEKTKEYLMIKDCLGSRTEHRIQNEFIFPDGKSGWFELRIEPVPAGAVVLSLDITERKNNENRIIFVNSMLQVIKQAHRLIYHERKREKLIQGICDLLVDNKDFVYSWIALFDGPGEMLYAAAAGNKNYRTIFFDNLRQGNRPECIERLDKYNKSGAFCCDIINNERDCQFKKSPRNYSCMVSRLEYEGRIFGVFAAGVTEMMAKEQEVQELFRELASDMACALK
jgi:PAS domain S-box-containing protein